MINPLIQKTIFVIIFAFIVIIMQTIALAQTDSHSATSTPSLFATLSPATGRGLPTVTIIAQDRTLKPLYIKVPAKTRFKIIIRNESKEVIEFESNRLRKEKVLAPGAKSFVVIAPLKAGKYDFFDEFHPENSQGSIIVE